MRLCRRATLGKRVGSGAPTCERETEAPPLKTPPRSNATPHDTRARHRQEKPIDDMRLRVAKEFERLAFADVRDVVAWERRPVFDADGNVTGYRDEITPTPSHRLKAGQAAAVKGVTTKSGSLKIEFHDKIAALTQMAKILGMTQDAAPSTVTVNQVNLNSAPENALEAARRLAFALAAAQQAAINAPEPPTLEGRAIETE
jgi:hypothetical protein